MTRAAIQNDSSPVIVILDGYTANPGDLSWEPIAKLGHLIVYDRTPSDDIVERASLAELVITNKVVLDRPVLEKLSHLRYVGVLATGYNVVDTAAAKELGVCVTNVPGYGTSAVAQFVFAHLLHLGLDVAGHAASVRQGAWSSAKDWCYWNQPLLQLDQMTMGIVGLGEIGKSTARVAQGFGMRVLAFSPNSRLPGVESVPLDTLLSEADVVSLHCPLTAETHQLINATSLARMKSTAYLINTSRGQLVDSSALAEALAENRLAGAGLDVLDVEPPSAQHPLVKARNCYITPHIAWATRPARRQLIETAAKNIAAFLVGKSINVVT